MEKQYVMTAVGPDRPGIVAIMAGFLSGKGYNLEESRMAVLGGEFAVILLVSATPSCAQPLSELVSELEGLTRMTITARVTTTPSAGRAGLPFLVHGYAMDHPGIVHALAQEIAALGANIEEMDTSTRPAPITGTPLFDVQMRISLPVGVSINDLRKRLSEVAEKRNMDVSIEPAPA
jgi:glycine cleavage system transcriptional repressor